MTRNPEKDWLRRISSTGAVSTLANNVGCTFMTKFTDGKLWIGSWGRGNGPMGVLKYDLGTRKLNSWTELWNPGKYDPEVKMEPAPIGSDFSPHFMSSGGAFIKDVYLFPSTKSTWVLAGQQEANLVRYAPSLMFAETSLSSYSMGRRVLNTLILTGTDKNEVNKLILYDTQSGNETVVFDGSNEIEIYDMVFVAGTNKLMFSGLRFSDGEFVVGEVSL
jgi:hypothetical protein